MDQLSVLWWSAGKTWVIHKLESQSQAFTLRSVCVSLAHLRVRNMLPKNLHTSCGVLVGLVGNTKDQARIIPESTDNVAILDLEHE